MKNNEHEAMGTNEHDERHERLCAYVLGELEGAERAALEAQLAEDAELRAEKERIEATISLVTSTCGGDEALAPEILGALERAAGPAAASAPASAPRIQPWYTRAPFQAAAGLAAIVTGVVGGRALWSDAPLSSPGRPAMEDLARLDDAGIERRGRMATDKDTLRDFDVETAQGANVADLAPVLADAEATMQGGLGRSQEQLGSAVGEPQPDVRARKESTFGLGLAGEAGNEGAASLQQPGDAATAVDQRVAAVAPSTGRTGSRLGGRGTYKGPGDSSPPAAGGGAGGGPSGPGAPAPGRPRTGRQADSYTGSDDFFLGKGQASGGAVAPPKTVDEVAALERARERPPVVGASRSSGPITPGPSGPSSPGPSGPGAPGYVAPGSPTPSAKRSSAGLPATSPPAEGSGARVALRAKVETTTADAGELLEGFELPEYEPEVMDSLKALGYLDADADGGDVRFYYDRDTGRRPLTPEQLDQLCELRTNRILQDCRRLPNERPRDMFFRFWGDNPFELAQIDNQSTFGVDVDTASYALARRYLNDGHLPTKAQVRTEEFLNYFKPDLPAPTEGAFGIHTELAPSRFGNAADAPSQRWLLRVGVRGKEVAREERKPLALTFVVDTSGSMKEHNRMELVKHALRLLVAQLDAQDSIAIVGFNNSASVILPMTSAQSRGVVEAAIYGLQPNGGTNAEGGLMLGYEVAAQGLTGGAHNRVVLLSDGVANIGQTDQDRVNASVKSRRDAGIYLNTIGVGMNNHNDVFLEQLANKGDGICNYVDSAAEARRALVDNFVGAFEPIARDVKIQVEFDRQQVYRYRLLGYENRAIADADFRNDAVDAGEIGSGHQVVALYELELTGAQSTEPFADVRLRWKAPTGPGRDPLEDSATEISQPVSLAQGTTYDAATGGYRRSVLVAQFAEILRRSVHARGDSLDELIAESQRLSIQYGDADFAEFVELLHKSRELIVRHAPKHDDLSSCIDAIRRNRILRAQLDELERAENKAVVSELQKQNDELEARIRDLVRSQVQDEMK